MFSNQRVFSSLAITDFVKEHLYGTSLIQPAENFNLTDHISMLDLPSVAWALAGAAFPAGFQYDRTCCVNPTACRHTTHGRLNLSRLLWVDKTRYTDDQLRQMSKRERNSVTAEQLQIYRAASSSSNERDVALNERVTVTLAVPSIQGHINSGLAWSAHIEKTYGSALTFDEKDREKYMRTQANTMVLRDIGHLIKKVSVDGVEISGDDFIEPILNDMSAQPHLVDKIKRAANTYLNDLSSALIAIPTYKCPKCNQLQPTSSKRYSELIPLDVINTFFYLLYQKQERHQA
jgi:hypothetical protein